MSNNSRINPMFADTASDSRLVSDATEVMISGVTVIPSAATWVVVLKDGAGNTIFYSDEDSINASVPFTVPFLTTGLVVNTLTNATVLIYTTP